MSAPLLSSNTISIRWAEREAFQKKKNYKLGLLAQPPLIPTYLRNLGPLNRCKGRGVIIE